MWYDLGIQIINLDNVEYIVIKNNKIIFHCISNSTTEIEYDTKEKTIEVFERLKNDIDELKKEGN